MSMFSGLDIVCVEEGTEIEHNGEKLVVSSDYAVQKGRKIYVTDAQYEQIKSQLPTEENHND